MDGARSGGRTGWQAGMGSLVALAALLLVMGQAGTGPFIHIDPIPDKLAGDRFTVTGTTSLPVGQVVQFQVYPTTLTRKGLPPGSLSGSARVTPWSGNQNRFSFEVDTSSLTPGTFIVTVEAVKQGVSQSAGFLLLVPFPTTEAPGTPLPATTMPADFIRIDPIPDRYIGDTFAITASTSLTEGEVAIFQVYPSTSLLQKSQTGETPGATGSVPVTRGDGGLNRLSFELDTAGFRPGEYLVTAKVGKQDTSHTSGFLLLETPPPVPFLRIDQVGERYAGTRFTITAATNLAAGEEVLFQVSSTVPAGGQDGDTGATGRARVVKGVGSLNGVSFELDSTPFLPGEYRVTATADSRGATDTTLIQLLPPATTAGPGSTGSGPLVMGALVIGLIVIGALAVARRGRAVPRGETGGPARPAGPRVSVVVRQGIEPGPSLPGTMGIHLDVETGIELPEGRPEG